MAAKIVLAALAALCCLQGLSAAAVPAAETSVDSSIRTLELELETLLMSLDTDIMVFDEKTQLTEEIQKSIWGCGKAIWATVQTLKVAKSLVDEWKQAKSALAEALVKCEAEEQEEVQATCVQNANTVADAALSGVKRKIPAALLAVGTAMWGLKTCASII